MDISTKYSHTYDSGNISKKRLEKLYEPEDQGVCCELV